MVSPVGYTASYGITARSVRNQLSITCPSDTRVPGEVASMVVIRSSPDVFRVGAPATVITGVPSFFPSTFAVIPGWATENGNGANTATATSPTTGREHRAMIRERERRESTE
ncbi:hypothetical protein GCM10017776_50390 [Streptomyces griseoluteus]|nr:hypothetical protein GCM10017776_50390 [Streptomyces griseoluteus]